MQFEVPDLRSALADPVVKPEKRLLPANTDIVVLATTSRPVISGKALQDAQIPFSTHFSEIRDIPAGYPDTRSYDALYASERIYVQHKYNVWAAWRDVFEQASPERFLLVIDDDVQFRIPVVNIYQLLSLAEDLLASGECDVVSFSHSYLTPYRRAVCYGGHCFVQPGKKAFRSLVIQRLLNPVARAFSPRYDYFVCGWHAGPMCCVFSPHSREKFLELGNGSGLTRELFLANEVRTLARTPSIGFTPKSVKKLCSWSFDVEKLEKSEVSPSEFWSTDPQDR